MIGRTVMLGSKEQEESAVSPVLSSPHTVRL